MCEVVALAVLSVTVLSVYSKVIPNYMNYEIRYSINPVSWSTAWATCQEHSQSDLVDIKDSVRIRALEHLFSTPETSAMKGPMWIGLHYVKSATGGEFRWSDCESVNKTDVPWMPDDTGNPEVSSCITAGRRAFMARTQNCNSNFVFLCQKINGDCSYTSFKNKICETKGRRAVLEGELSNSECEDRCSVDKSGSDLCWAYERNKTTDKCTLIFSPSPFACVSQVPRDETESAARNCFEFSDITGEKEKVVDSNAPVSACVSPAVTTTTATQTTTSITTSTTTETNPTQSSTSSTAESTHTEASAVTTTTTAITTMTAISELSTVTFARMSIASTSESPAVTTASAAATTTASVTDTPTPVSSTMSTTAFSSDATRGAFSPSLDTFLSRLEAALTHPTSVPTPKVTSLGRHVYEACVVIQTFTVAERKKRTDDIVTDLTLDKKNLSSYRRKKSSAEDERPSAQSVGGGVAIILLVTAALIIILPDCASIFMHVVHAHKKKQLVPA